MMTVALLSFDGLLNTNAANAACRLGNITLSLGQSRCSGNDRYYCNFSNKLQKTVTCTYGCYTEGTNAYCKCQGGKRNGQKFCKNQFNGFGYSDYQYTCQYSTSSGGEYTNREQCPGGCSRTGSQCHKCKSGNSICRNRQVGRCVSTSDGNRYSYTACAHGCYSYKYSSGVQAAGCNDCSPRGAKQCSGTKMMACQKSSINKLKWSQVSSCPNGCQAPNICHQCSLGSKSCSGRKKKVCTAVNGSNQWVLTQCAKGCHLGICNSCAPSSKVCSGSGTSQCIKLPTGGTEIRSEACPYGCKNGNCNECSTVGQQRCNGSNLQVCRANSTGNKWITQTCAYGCGDGKCHECNTTNERTCSDNYKKVCRLANGQKVWKSNSCKYGCYQGYCNKCEPNSRMCKTTRLALVCKPTSTGWRWVAKPCRKVCRGNKCR